MISLHMISVSLHRMFSYGYDFSFIAHALGSNLSLASKIILLGLVCSIYVQGFGTFKFLPMYFSMLETGSSWWRGFICGL